MKKLSLLLAFILAITFCVKAQDGQVVSEAQTNQTESQEEGQSDGKHFFMGAGVRANVYLNDNARTSFHVWEMPSLGGDLYFGKWFSSKVGSRIIFSGGSLHPFFQDEVRMEHEKYVSGRLDLLLNLTNCFRTYSPKRFYNFVPNIGIGASHAFNIRNRPFHNLHPEQQNVKSFTSLMFGGGLLNTFRISDKVAAYLDLKLNLVDAQYDGWKEDEKFNGIYSASVGIVYNFVKTPKKVIVPPPPVQPQQPPPPPQPEPEPEPVVQPPEQPPYFPPRAFVEHVFFRLDKTVIDGNQFASVKKAAEFLIANPTASLLIIGYADVETGNASYNMRLSENRAKNVARMLVSDYGISSARLKLDWKGDTVQPFPLEEFEKNRVVILTNDY